MKLRTVSLLIAAALVGTACSSQTRPMPPMGSAPPMMGSSHLESKFQGDVIPPTGISSTSTNAAIHVASNLAAASDRVKYLHRIATQADLNPIEQTYLVYATLISLSKSERLTVLVELLRRSDLADEAAQYLLCNLGKIEVESDRVTILTVLMSRPKMREDTKRVMLENLKFLSDESNRIKFLDAATTPWAP
ncbi:MAG: hypothetical protein WCI73_13010 [Phycisphaerae bacterium]